MTGALLEAIVLDNADDAYAVSLGGELLLFTRDEALAWREAKLIAESFAWPRALIVRSGPHCLAAIETLLAKDRDAGGEDQVRQVASNP